MTQSYVLTLKTLKTLGLPWLCGLQQHFAGIVYDQHISIIVFSNWGPGCMFLLWSVVLLLCKCTVPPECGDFFWHNLNNTTSKGIWPYTSVSLCWSAFCLVLPCCTTELSCTLLRSSLQQSLHAVKLFLQFFMIFPKLSQYFSSSSVSCSYCGSLQPHVTT